MKKILFLGTIYFVLLGILIGCGSKEEPMLTRSGPAEIAVIPIEKAISKAILDENSYKYAEGEAKGEGHTVLNTVTTDETTVVYALTTYGEYGFQNGVFTKISGTGVIPAKMTFEKEDEDYILTDFEIPEDGSGYMESIKRIFPSDLQDKVSRLSDSDYKACLAQEFEYAKAYLKEIGRNAEVKDQVDFKLPDTNAEVGNKLIDLYHEYPYWIGTEEKVEHGVRYVYETSWSGKGNGDGTITYKKYKYDNKEVIEEYVIEINGENMTYLKGEARTSRNENSIAKEVRLENTVEVDLDGDGKNEKVFYSLDDFKINDVSYKKDIETLVYEDNPDEYSYIIVDLDKSDNQKEIVLKSEGPSDDPSAHIFTYKNGLVKLGGLPAFVSYYDSFDGKGNIYADVRLDILQTWFAPETWSLKNNEIVRNTDHIYYPRPRTVTLKVDLPVYKDMNSKETTIIKPQKVTITQTDNKQFCYLEAEDGSKGWFKVKGYSELPDLDNAHAWDAFDGLIYAD